MPFTKTVSLAALVGIALLPNYTDANHSYSEYDDAKSVEVEGKLVGVAWQNPHARILIESVGAAGARVTWDIESAGLNNFRPDLAHSNTPSIRGSRSGFARNECAAPSSAAGGRVCEPPLVLRSS